MRDDGIKGAIKVFGEALQQPDKAKAILVGTNDNTAEVVKMVLQKYQVTVNPEKYGLFERTPEGGKHTLLPQSFLSFFLGLTDFFFSGCGIAEEYPINDFDYPLLVKTFWDSQSIQREICIKEKYPNIGLFTHTLQRSDALKNSPLAGELNNYAAGPTVELADKSLADSFRDSLFGGGTFSALPGTPSPSTNPFSPSGSEVDPFAEDGETSASVGSSDNLPSRSRSSSDASRRTPKMPVKTSLRLSAFGMEALELVTA